MSDFITDFPIWHSFSRYILEALADGSTQHRRDLLKKAVGLAPLTGEQRELVYAEGALVGEHRAGWALSALTRAGAVARPARGYFQITQIGQDLLNKHSGLISKSDLMALPAWDEYTPSRRESNRSYSELDSASEGIEPEARILQAQSEISQGVASELLSRLQNESPEFFERAVLELLKAMGYGGVERQALHTGRSGDGGIDGVLDQDALGLSKVHVQAKRYADGNTIGRPEIQQFTGALASHNAQHGVFVTSSRFTKEAVEDAARGGKIALIDGSRLVELMIQYKVGVQVKKSIELVQLDEDFFD